MVHIRHTVLILLALSCTVVCGEEEESFYDQLTRAVIRLEHREFIQTAQTPPMHQLEIGTAFFARTGNELYVVSARHVVEKKHDFSSRVQLLNVTTGAMAMFRLELPYGNWVYHPNNGDKDTHYVDVAAMKICVPVSHTPKCFGYEPADPNMKEKNQLPPFDAEPPEPILVFGFPDTIGFQLLEQRPMARLGIMSMSAGKEFLKYHIGDDPNDPNLFKFAEERCCLIDARMFGGNSGSPVMNQIRLGNSKPRLLGLVTATNRTLDFGVIEPVSRIRETLDIAKTKPATGRWTPISGNRDKIGTGTK
jgi:hypothetical protein